MHHGAADRHGEVRRVPRSGTRNSTHSSAAALPDKTMHFMQAKSTSVHLSMLSEKVTPTADCLDDFGKSAIRVPASVTEEVAAECTN